MIIVMFCHQFIFSKALVSYYVFSFLKKQLQAIQSANQKEKGPSPHQSNWTTPKSIIPSQ